MCVYVCVCVCVCVEPVLLICIYTQISSVVFFLINSSDSVFTKSKRKHSYVRLRWYSSFVSGALLMW